MTRTDSFVVGTLVVLLALVAGVIGVPALQAAVAERTPTGSAEPGFDEPRPYVEGVMGAPVSVSPLTAKTQADRDLVALVFSGLVRNGPAGTIVPDLAERWEVDDKGKTWTVHLRDDVTWHDGEPLTVDDVLYTIRTLKDPDYTGPAAGSWREVSASSPAPGTVVFTLSTPLGGFLQALTQPIAPAHLLRDVPVDVLPDHPFGRQPVGTGPFELVSLDQTKAVLAPAVADSLDDEGGEADPSALPTDSLTTAAPPGRPERPLPYLPGIEFHFYTDPEALSADFRAGRLDAASGISPEVAASLRDQPGARLLRYPGATLTAVVLNLRPSHPEFADPKVRNALLQAIDRPAIIESAFAGSAATATGLIPSSSPMFDPAANPPVMFDRKAANAALKDAGWSKKDGKWYLPKAKKPLEVEVLSPTLGSNPGLFAAAAAVVEDWNALGITATHTPLQPGEFVTEHLAPGEFQVAVVDVLVGLDPDLYPLLASSQTLTGGSNILGLQDPALDELLEAARKPGSDEERKKAYSELQKQLAKGRYVLPLTYADEVSVVQDWVSGPVVRQATDGSDRFWDVLTWRLAGGP